MIALVTMQVLAPTIDDSSESHSDGRFDCCDDDDKDVLISVVKQNNDTKW